MHKLSLDLFNTVMHTVESEHPERDIDGEERRPRRHHVDRSGYAANRLGYAAN